MVGRIVIISGTPYTGRDTIAKRYAENSDYVKSVHLQDEPFFQAICKGFASQTANEAWDQNACVFQSIMASARCFAENGYEVVISATIGPWFLKLLYETVELGHEVHYILLRANRETILKRVSQKDLETAVILNERFNRLGNDEHFALEISKMTSEEAALAIRQIIDEKTHLLQAV